MPLTAAAVALAATAVPDAAVAADPQPGVFSGSLGVPVPPGGRAAIRAIDRTDGRIVAAVRAGRSGRFTLTLPPGAFAVAASVLTKTGRRTTRPLVGLTLKPGQRRRNASLKQARRARRRRARAAFVQERGQVSAGRIAVVVPTMTGLPDADGKVSAKSLSTLLADDLVNLGSGQGRCRFAVRELERIDEVKREAAFSQSRYADPQTRIALNLIVPDVVVRGTLTRTRAPLPTGSRIAYDARLVDARTGAELGRATGSFTERDWFTGETEMARKVAEELCKLSDVYEVKLDVRGAGTFATHNATGTLQSTIRARRGTGADTATWRGSGVATWSGLAFTTKIAPCIYVSPVPGVMPWSVTLTDRGDGSLQVTWSDDAAGASAGSTASVDCPPSGPDDPDPPPVPGQPGPALVATGPTTFTVPHAGGAQPVAGEVASGDGSIRNAGVITVTPAGIEGPTP